MSLRIDAKRIRLATWLLAALCVLLPPAHGAQWPVRLDPGHIEVFDPSLDSVGGFRPLTEALDPGRPTVVLVHGWNIDRATDLNRPGGWTFRATHPQGYGCSRGKLGGREDLNLLAWNWLYWAESRLAYGLPDGLVLIEGALLARALHRELGGRSEAPIHLVGHSLGGGVCTWAALWLALRYGRPVEQLTLFDVPELETRLERSIGGLIRVRPLRLEGPLAIVARGGTFVDNYPSAFGKTYGSRCAANVDLETALSPSAGDLLRQPSGLKLAAALQKVDDHFYPAAWYFGWQPDEEIVEGVPPWPRGALSGTVVDCGPELYIGTPYVGPNTPLQAVGAAWSTVLVGGRGPVFRPGGGGLWRIVSIEDPYRLILVVPAP